MKKILLPALAVTLMAASPPSAPLAPSEIVAAAPKADWVAISPHDLMVMMLGPDAKGPKPNGKTRRVVIQLMPAPFSQGWVGNMRTLAAANWWDGTSINRVQDNYVVQWGDASERKALPPGLIAEDERSYRVAPYHDGLSSVRKRKGPKDLYADWAGHKNGWPLAGDKRGWTWPVHCYAMVGVGRDMPPNTGTGAELYTVIGHAPRHLDRNIALVGRVIEGIEHLSSLPRGTGALGFYETPEERVGIQSIRIADGLPAADQPRFEYLSTESTSFAAYADARANRRDAFFITPAGGADICNIPVPVRRVKE